jgi:hypothetical protein
VPYYHPPQIGAPPTGILFATAIRHGQRSILEFLQSIYPRVDLAESVIVRAILARPDIAMLQLVHSQSPRICSFLFNSHGDCFLTVAFKGGLDNAPLVHFLLDHGEFPQEYDIHGCRPPLLRAIQHQQPIEVIEKMVSRTLISNRSSRRQSGSNVRTLFRYSIREGRSYVKTGWMKGMTRGCWGPHN